MTFCSNLPLFCIIACLVCSVVSSMLSGKAARILTLALSVFVCISSILVCKLTELSNGPITYTMGHYTHPWGNEIRFGPLEPYFCALFSLVLFCSVLSGRQQLEKDLEEKKRNLYYVMLDLVLVSILALVYTNDLFTGYVFIEICTISSCGLLMIKNIGRTTLASVRYMVFSLIGSGLFLLGVILLYGITGHLLMPDLLLSVRNLWETGEYHHTLLASISLMTIGLCIKSGLCPFHLWMPDTYGSATPTSGAVLSGIISKGYIFLLLKIITRVVGKDVFYATGMQNILLILGCLGVIVGSLSAMTDRNLFHMIAFSSASQIGYIYMGIGISPEAGMLAACFHILCHSLTKPLLFLSAGQLGLLVEGKQVQDFTGSARRNPLAGVCYTIGSLSMIGIPMTVGFVSKFYFAKAALSALPVVMILVLFVLVLSTVLNTIYYMRSCFAIWLPEHPGQKVSFAKQASFDFGILCLALLILICGICPMPILDWIENGLFLL